MQNVEHHKIDNGAITEYRRRNGFLTAYIK